LLDFRESALAVGETNRIQSFEDTLGFGSLTKEGGSPENGAKCREAVRIVQDMGVPRTLAIDWQLG
jgi:hypothetical protein